MPESKLVKIVGQYLDVTKLRPDAKAKATLLAEVQAFEKASLEGEYYESFNVNSKNFLETSTGTGAWIAECRRLLDRCTEAKKVPPAEARDALERIFGLLRHIDEGHDDVVFFADEGGSWQVGVNWAEVFPWWFACLAATAAPEEYARQVLTAMDEFENFHRDKHLATARRIATPEQRKALQAATRSADFSPEDAR
ncbi:MAG: hypothetical protein ACREXW_09275 [Gammaproteobacteria bacterium]